MTTQISGTTGVSQVQDGVVTDSKLTLTANSAPIKTALNASGNPPIFAARAWVKFNAVGTVTINASGNVVGITDNAVGNFTVNFTTAMADANFASVGQTGSLMQVNSKTASSITVVTTASTSATPTDYTDNNISVFR